MKAAFVHDHVFPKYQGEYYESSGFDRVFADRYLGLFGNVQIMARWSEVGQKPSSKFGVLAGDGLSFCCLSSAKLLLKNKDREEFKKKLLECDCAVIRLPSVLGLAAVDICRKVGFPYIVEVVGCPWDAVSTRGYKWWGMALGFTLLTKRAVRSAKYVVYVTEHFLQTRYPTKGKTIPCSNVTLENYGESSLVRRIEKLENMKPGDTIRIGTCASIDTVYKGQDVIIRALPLLIQRGFDVQYELVGGGNQTKLRTLAAELDVDQRVVFLGELNHDAVFDWLDTIDIYVHPSKQEGLCRAIIEAMSRACPVIAADAGGIHEQIDEALIFGKSNYKEFVEMFTHTNREYLIEQAKRNHGKAATYCSDVLYERRRTFFSNFMKENHLS